MPTRRTDAPSVPFLVAVGGLVASGKTHVARGLAERLGAVHIEADRIRDELVASGAGDTASTARELRSFEPLFAPAGYAELRRRAEAEIAAGRSVVLDACCPRAAQREGLRSIARRYGVRFLFVECRIDAATRRARLAERDARPGESGWTEIAETLARTWELPEAESEAEYLVVDTSGPLEDALAAVMARLETRSSPAFRDDPASPPDAVTFDCWQTLLFEADWETAHALRVSALARAGEEAGIDTPPEVATRAFDAAWERHMRLWSEGIASGAAEVASWALASLGARDAHPALEHLTQLFQEASHTGRVEALPGAGDTLEALARTGVHRALVCDTGLTPGRVVRQHLQRLGLLELLEVQAFSDEVGVPKPDLRIFRAALDPLGVAPHRAVHVGDLRRTDVAGARSVGMCAVRISARHDDRGTLPEADYVVRSHAELQALLTPRVGERTGTAS